MSKGDAVASRRPRIAVEGDASGAAAFDGNHSHSTVSWLFSNAQWSEANAPEMFDQLMEYTKRGHLAWVCFPKEGFRL